MQELGHQPPCLGVAEFHCGLAGWMMIDRSDSIHAPALRQLGMRLVLLDILMRDPDNRCRLARKCRDLLSGHRT